ncbi:DUF6708 domain-containing protein [Pseudomonas asiatica]|uniref:DUF6708 domain-containing protein n=1 Tax=Pseudomonas asiatica TaxID=2219225 RepID=UPI00383B4505
MKKQAPNHQCAIYLEIARQSTTPRCASSILTVILCIPLTLNIYLMLSSLDIKNPESIIHSTLELMLITWGVATGILIDTTPPLDEPIRFNRLRQKIYAYNFMRQWWNPFDMGKIAAVSYDWSQVRAELWAQTRSGLIVRWGVMLSIVAPGTNNVIDRFHLSMMGTDELTWAYICTYMQEGPSALPPPGTPKDHDDILWCEFALRLAPPSSVANGNGSGVENRPLRLEQKESETVISDSSTVAVGFVLNAYQWKLDLPCLLTWS